MRSALCTALLCLLAAAAPAAAQDGGMAKGRMSACVTALDQAGRSATFSADMRTIRRASRLQVKFVLQARTEEERQWASVAAPGFGTWNTSAPGIGRYVHTKTVENLLAPASYRVLMHFRWMTAAGRTLLRERRTTRVCRQPDLRPDIAPEDLVRTADGYEATIVNEGRGAADSFVVTVVVGNATYQIGYVERLEGRGRIRLSGAAPACRPGELVTLHVDADGAVEEADEEANSMSVACPDPYGL